MRPTAMTACKGMPGFLHNIKDKLIEHVFKLREMGVAVRNNMIRIKAIELKPEFDEKTRHAQERVVERWVKKSSFCTTCGNKRESTESKGNN